MGRFGIIPVACFASFVVIALPAIAGDADHVAGVAVESLLRGLDEIDDRPGGVAEREVEGALPEVLDPPHNLCKGDVADDDVELPHFFLDLVHQLSICRRIAGIALHDTRSGKTFGSKDLFDLLIRHTPPAVSLRITYVGELGWELHIPVQHTARVYDALRKSGDRFGLCNAGYSAAADAATRAVALLNPRAKAGS